MYCTDKLNPMEIGKLEAQATTLDGSCPFAKLMLSGLGLWHDTIKGVYKEPSLKKYWLQVAFLEDTAYAYSNYQHRLSKEEPNKAESMKLKNARIVLYWVEALKLMIPGLCDIEPESLARVFGRVYSDVDEYSKRVEEYFGLLVKTVNENLKDERILSYIDSKQKAWDNMSSRSLMEAYLKKTLLALEATAYTFIYLEQCNK